MRRPWWEKLVGVWLGGGRTRQPLRDGPASDLRAAGEAELVEDVFHVQARGTLGDDEPVADLPVRQPLSNQDDNLALASRQR